MLNTKVPCSQTALIPVLHKPIVLGNAVPSFPAVLKQPSSQQRKRYHFCTRSVPSPIRATAVWTRVDYKVKVVVTVQFSGELPKSLGSLSLELVATNGVEKPGEKPTSMGRAVPTVQEEGGVVRYVTDKDMLVPAKFDGIGAVKVVSEIENKEIFIEDIQVLSQPNQHPIMKFSCRSWVQPESIRYFFASQSYLPSETPPGLWWIRNNELRHLRGDGQGERKPGERIYDYDVYNDLGDPDEGKDLVRPVLGGTDHPYPRRCRTGRPPSKTDPNAESKSDGPIYVPRDEAFSDVKAKDFNNKLYVSIMIGKLATQGVSPVAGFPNFTAIDLLFSQGVDLEVQPEEAKNLQQRFPRIIKSSSTSKAQTKLKFDAPELMEKDKFSWLKDTEFGRQTLAGLNPYAIRLVTEQEWPLKSKLDPEIYGPPESKLTAELIQPYIKDFMTVEEALKNKKLFILDYHDWLLPYVNQLRELEGYTLYGSRTLFFLTPSGTLTPIGIELTRPPGGDNKSQWKEVFQPSWGDATETWVWKLAKTHVLAHDAGYHQLISHWLRTHCCMEPYVIAANRHLSAMHPIYRLLHPYFRYTMAINAAARQQLVNAGGIIESTFFLGKYSMVMSSDVYTKFWQFNLEGLPADLIHRGLAVEDKNAQHGLKLAIEDYPFANDGLILWDAIKEWVTAYVNHYYRNPSILDSDIELQAWWTEVRTVGHGDKKDESWWPVLKTPEDLIGILTTIIWVASGHHAAVNFGQYEYGAYTPNRPTIARTNMPTEDKTKESWASFKGWPENEMLSCFPSQVQSTTVMAILNVLSDHSPDEEYIGDKIEPSWEAEPVIKEAFNTFNGRMKDLEKTIDARNADESLINRNGAGVVPYKLLMPFSGPGVTGKGVPNSISI